MKFISATSFLLISSGMIANAAPQPNIDTPGGMCASDNDCYKTIRSVVPLGAIGPELCECYATSIINPFDETEDSTKIHRARCDPRACDGFEAYCPIAPNDNGLAECALRRVAGSSSSSLPSDDTPTTSSSSSDDTPRPQKRPGVSSSSSSSSSDDSSLPTGFVSPTPAPPSGVKVMAQM